MIGENFATVFSQRFREEAAVFDYGDKEVFKRLWTEKIDGTPSILDDINGKKHIFIVWDGREDSSDPAARFAVDLTPLDWALAFSLRVFGMSDSSLEGLRVHVIDLTGHKFVNAWAVRMRHQMLAEMPWVSLHASLIPCQGKDPIRYRRAYSHIVAVEDGEVGLLTKIQNGEIKVTLSVVGEPMPGKNADVKFALESLAQQWTASLVQSDDHHNVNNFVGPAILSRLIDFPSSPTTSDLLDAFIQKLNWTNSLSRKKRSNLDRPPSFEKGLAATGITGMRVLVVDDELARGWDCVICGLFSKKRGKNTLEDKKFVRLDEADSGTDPIQIYGCDGPAPLLEVLGKDIQKRFFERDLEFSFIGEDNRAELLVLDLRFFKQAASENSRTYIRGLVTKIQEWDLCRGENLAWPPIDEREIKSVENWLDRKSEPIDPTMEASIITLLPRMLALAAPLTPIILFSSTGRADIKEKLKAYRNIVTGFSKPQALQDFGTIRESVAEFAAGVEAGMRMLGLRSRLAKCMSIARGEETIRRQLYKTNIGTKAHIDLYFDESGNRNTRFLLASAATVFKSVDEANRLQKYLKSKARNGSVDEMLPVWRKGRTNPGTPLLKYTEIKRRTAEPDLFKTSVQVLKQAIQESKASVAWDNWTTLCVYKYQDLPTQVGSRKFRWMDEQLDLMLRFSVQFNYCVLPRYLGFKQTTCNLYFDRRSIPPTEIKYNDEKTWNTQIRDKELTKAEELSKRYGCDITQPPLSSYDKYTNPGGPDKVLLTTYPESAYYPFVREALLGWAPNWTASIKDQVIRGQQLSECSYGYNLDSGDHLERFNKRRWLHDVADWVAGAERDTSKQGRSQLKDIFATSHKTELDVGLDASLRAARSASWGHEDECIRALMENPRVYTLESELNDVERILIWVCLDTLRLASGKSLHLMLKEGADLDASSQPPQGQDKREGQTAPEDLPIPTPVPNIEITPPLDPWLVVALYQAPKGYEVLEVSSKETIGDQDYWVLRQQSGTEVAVSPVRDEDSEKDRIGHLGLFDTSGYLVTRRGKGDYYAFALDSWFVEEADFLEIARSTEIDEQLVEPSVIAQREDVSSAPASEVDETVVDAECKDRAVALDIKGRVPSTDVPTGPEIRHTSEVCKEQLDSRSGISDWRALPIVIEGAIEARVFKVESNKVVLRSSDLADRRQYCSDETNLPSLVRDDRVIILPRQGGTLQIQGYFMCDLVAWYSVEMGTWKVV